MKKTKKRRACRTRDLPVARGRWSDKRRWERVDTCGECGACTGNSCEPARVPGMRSYTGVRFTADGFDCALPVTVDSHSLCSFSCIYCFSDNLVGHVDSRKRAKNQGIGQASLGALESIFSGGGGRLAANFRMALRYDKRNRNGYPCPIQLGGINDPMDNVERQQGWFLEFVKLAIRYQQPVRVSTKGNLALVPEYQKAIAQAPHLFWFAFSIISPDDRLMAKVDLRAPPPSERIKAMKALSDLGCSTSLRFRPLIPGISDRTSRYSHAWRTLIDMAADAGAKAASVEVMFYPQRVPEANKAKWERLERLSGTPLREVYRSFGPIQACTRPAYRWTEGIMHAIRDRVHEHGMTLGVSDPVWKQLTDVGCCCGIKPDDPVFGNWEVENATNHLLLAREDPKRIIKLSDITPPWASHVRSCEMYHAGVGPGVAYQIRHETWADKLRDVWENVKAQRSPLNYFQGALRPVKLDDGQIGFRYVGLKRHHDEKVPYWRV